VYGYEYWSLILSKEHRVRVFENMVLRKVFGSNWEEATRCRMRLHEGDRYDPYCPPNNIWLIKSRWTRLAGHMAGKERCRQGLVGKT